MDYEERRAHKRSDVEPGSEDTFLEFAWGGATYRFKPLDTSSGGMGMLVTDDDSEVLEKISVGDKIEMKYCTPEEDLFMIFKVRHISRLKQGLFAGHYQVGLSL